MTEKHILIAADHAGFALKTHLIDSLTRQGFQVVDLGTESTESVDYPDYGHKAAKALLAGQAPLGIVICGTGIGISISANRFKGVRCALCHNSEFAALARQHNDANILALPGRFVSPEQADEIVTTFINTAFEGGRHQNRVLKIDQSV